MDRSSKNDLLFQKERKVNFIFKVRHYLHLYFRRHFNYSFIGDNIQLEKNYWIKGYQTNIDTKKWEIENGIPLGLYNGSLKAPLAQRVHIAGLNEYCFALTEKGRESEQKKVVDFLLDHLKQDSSKKPAVEYAYWETYKDNTLNEYYVHGMGQGQILSMLTRYALFISKESNANVIEFLIKISNSYLIPFNDNHGFVKIEGSSVIFEEYPKNQDVTSHVLNGWMYSLIGLYDYLSFAKKIKIKDDLLHEKETLFDRSIKTLANKLPLYNMGYWSLYNLPKSTKNICSIHYQEQHIVLLQTLFFLSKEEIFKIYSDKFKKQYHSVFCRILSFFIKVFITNIWKYKRIYKRV